jgi:tRNA-dihydrouridine synthase 3
LSNEFAAKDCPFGLKCKFEHDLRKYLSEGKVDELSTFDGRCPVWEERKFCPAGWRCRFSGSHSKEIEREGGRKELVLLFDDENVAQTQNLTEKEERGIFNSVDKSIRIDLNRRRVKLEKSEEYLKWLNESWNVEIEDANNNRGKDDYEQAHKAPGHDSKQEDDNVKRIPDTEDALKDQRASFTDPPFRPSEKRRLYYGPDTPILAPLTTQGNLPFRQLCVSLGAQLTFSEMALGLPLVQGEQNEWTLMKAHESEVSPPTLSEDSKTVHGYDNRKDLKFGVQIAAPKPWVALKTTEVIAKYCPHVRVIDLNCGCPIDLVCNTGAGSALLDSPTKLEKILRGMNSVSGEIPVSCKIRMGTRDSKPNADSVVKRLVLGSRGSQDAGLGPPGVAAITLHGRTKQQRYQKLANWSYISDIATLIARVQKEDQLQLDTSREVDPRDRPNGGQTYFIGNGDVFSHADYFEHLADHKVDAVMIGRGALIKPWVFEEIQAGQYLDKSSSERLGYIKMFVKYGLDTWGSDERGVGTTRRFLLEWLSFTQRYIPIGILEHLPPKMNERPPAFMGRDDLETLMASSDHRDWLKIAEMFLGKAGEGFKFVPKHKSNSYEIEAEG